MPDPIQHALEVAKAYTDKTPAHDSPDLPMYRRLHETETVTAVLGAVAAIRGAKLEKVAEFVEAKLGGDYSATPGQLRDLNVAAERVESLLSSKGGPE